ncbi:probable sulfate transporter 3.4 [Tanacetum coccineum]
MAVDDTKISNIFTSEFILEVGAGSVYISPPPYPASAGLGMLLLLCSLCIFFFGGFLISVPIGLAITVRVSVFKILLHVTRPNTGVLGNIPGTQVYQNVNRYREARRLPVSRPLSTLPILLIDKKGMDTEMDKRRGVISSQQWHSLKCVILDMTGKFRS